VAAHGSQNFADQESKIWRRIIYEPAPPSTALDAEWRLDASPWGDAGVRILNARWNTTCELMMIYLLGDRFADAPFAGKLMGSWTRRRFNTRESNIFPQRSDFTHQYSQAWYDFRTKRDAYAYYFRS